MLQREELTKAKRLTKAKLIEYILGLEKQVRSTRNDVFKRQTFA